MQMMYLHTHTHTQRAQHAWVACVLTTLCSKSSGAGFLLLLQLFSAYECGTEKRVFGVSLAQLVDALSVFSSAAKADLHILYPGPDGELQLE